MTRVLWIALVAAACGHPAPPPTPVDTHVVRQPPPDAAPAPNGPLDQDLPRLTARTAKLYQDIVAVFTTAGEDCAAAATKLGELQATYADVVAANAKVFHDGRLRELRVALEPHAAEMSTAAKSIVESKTLATCSKDRTFTDAFDKLVQGPQ